MLTWAGVCTTRQDFPFYVNTSTTMLSCSLCLTCTLFGAILATSSQISNITAVLTLNHYFCHRHTLLMRDVWGCTKKQEKSKRESPQEARLLERYRLVICAPSESIHSSSGNQTRCCDSCIHKVNKRGCLQIFC